MIIVLVHSMGGRPFSLALLVGRLRRAGHVTHSFGYSPRRESFDRIVDRFVHATRALVEDRPYALVTHSFGGIVARAAMPALSEAPLRHLIMLAPPNQPPLLARRLHRRPLYRLLFGECGQCLADPTFYRDLPVPDAPVTIVAGTAGRRGRLSPFRDEPNDGMVSVAETRIGPDDPVIEIPALHTFIMNARPVTRVILGLLDPPP